jgi:hypothetical protein
MSVSVRRVGKWAVRGRKESAESLRHWRLSAAVADSVNARSRYVTCYSPAAKLLLSCRGVRIRRRGAAACSLLESRVSDCQPVSTLACSDVRLSMAVRKR